MSRHSYPLSIGLKEEKPKIYFTSWFLADQKWSSLLLIVFSMAVGLFVWQRCGEFLFGLSASIALLAMVWNIFVPVYFELNSDGIVFWTFGQKRFIAWEDIRVYQIRRNGILLLPASNRFVLESFRGFFLPVPSSLMPEVLYRFRVFVDRIPD